MPVWQPEQGKLLCYQRTYPVYRSRDDEYNIIEVTYMHMEGGYYHDRQK